MAILSVATDLKDLRERIGKIVLAYDKKGNPVTTTDLEVAGAMTAWMRNTINPTLCYTVEHQPCLVHAGPFANIAIGQSSIIGDRVALKLFDYHVTESGFAADIGLRKILERQVPSIRPQAQCLRRRLHRPRAQDARRRPGRRRRPSPAQGVHGKEPRPA
jgi:formyltetrahydrofolate synthetase